MSYDVQIKDLRDSAKAARSAATQIGTITPGDALTGALAAIPGASSVSAMQRVSSGWTTELTDSTQYELDDEAARAAFSSGAKENG